MMMILLVVAIAAGMLAVERLWPAMELPRVDNWWARVALVNLVQLGIVLLAGVTWDRWLAQLALIRLQDHLGTLGQAAVAYLVSTFVYYWWHRLRHDSRWFWRICHQLHHSPRRIELVTSFYKHPVEITLNSLLSAAIVYPLLGCTVEAAALYTLFTAVAELFYTGTSTRRTSSATWSSAPRRTGSTISTATTARTTPTCRCGTSSSAPTTTRDGSRRPAASTTGARTASRTCWRSVTSTPRAPR
jgi:hypothetical protein